MPSGAGRCRKALDQFLAKIDGELVDPEARAIVRVLADELDALADRTADRTAELEEGLATLGDIAAGRAKMHSEKIAALNSRVDRLWIALDLVKRGGDGP